MTLRGRCLGTKSKSSAGRNACERGAAAVEFAILLPVFVVLVFGIFEFGWGFSHYLIVLHAAREGARMAAVGQYSETLVRDRAVPIGYEKDTVGNYVMTVSKTPAAGAEVTGEPVTVTVTYPERIAIPIFGTRDFNLQGAAVMRYE